jgi:hypothetical protein
MTHTTTEEREFIVDLDHPILQHSVEEATKQLASRAKKQGFEYEIPGTFVLTVSRSAPFGAYHVHGVASYAKIVLAAQPAATPGPYDAPGVGTAEPEDEYAEHDRRKAAELGMDVETYKRAVEDR